MSSDWMDYRASSAARSGSYHNRQNWRRKAVVAVAAKLFLDTMSVVTSWM
jgi:hypothetical protein